MQKGDIKKQEILATFVTILFLLVIGAWVYHMTPKSKKKSIDQQNTPAVVSQKIQEEGKIIAQENLFTPLGTSSIAVKLSDEYVFSPTEVPVKDPNHFKTVIESTNSDDSFAIEIITLAAVVKGCAINPCPGFLSEEDYLLLQKSYQENGFVDEDNQFLYNDREYTFSQTDTPSGIGRVEYLRTFFGDTYMLQVSHEDKTASDKTPSEVLEDFMQSTQFTSKYFSRSALKHSLAMLFAEKNAMKDSVLIENLWATENHVRGEVILEKPTQREAGLFFGVKDNNEWVLVYEGNGSFKCSVLEFHAFPEQMQDGCR